MPSGSDLDEVNSHEKEIHWGGGEGDSSRTHSFSDSDYDDQLYGIRTVLNNEKGLASLRMSAYLLLIILNSVNLS